MIGMIPHTTYSFIFLPGSSMSAAAAAAARQITSSSMAPKRPKLLLLIPISHGKITAPPAMHRNRAVDIFPRAAGYHLYPIVSTSGMHAPEKRPAPDTPATVTAGTLLTIPADRHAVPIRRPAFNIRSSPVYLVKTALDRRLKISPTQNADTLRLAAAGARCSDSCI